MDILSVFILSVIQGLTEFLPISSSGHLILAPHIFGFADQGLSLDVAVHFGSLIAIVAYFWRDVLAILNGWFRALPPSAPSNPEARLGWAVIVGVIPVVVAGLLLKSIIESQFREPWIIGVATIFFGLVLWQADWSAKRERDLTSITLKDAIIVGLAQILALIPGTSRSGITMTAGLWVGLTREAASRFSFLLAIPTVLASSALITFDLLETTEAVDWNAIILGVVLSAISAYLCIHYFLKFIERIGMWPFVLYRLAIGAFIFYLIA